MQLFEWVAVTAITLLLGQAGFCEESYETDRGYREPAVIGPPVIEPQFGNNRSTSLRDNSTEDDRESGTLLEQQTSMIHPSASSVAVDLENE